MTIKDVSAATMYDVIHDGVYRSSWDPTMVESYDISRLSANADFGYYACKTSAIGRLDYAAATKKKNISCGIVIQRS